MGHTLKWQFESAIGKCHVPGQSKRCDKFDKLSNTEHKIYSNAYLTDLNDLAQVFSSFIKGRYPKIKLIRDIKEEHCQSFLDSRVESCVDGTIKKLKTHLKKLEKACVRKFKHSNIEWNTDSLTVPTSVKDIKWKKNKVIEEKLADKVAATMKTTSSSEAYKGVILGKCLGVRVNEAVHLKAGRISLTGGVYGYGEAEIVKGPEGGAKGGRARIIPILSAENRDELRTLIAGRSKDDYIIESKRGGMMKSDTLRSAVAKAFKTLGLEDTYKGTKLHGTRKAYAQRIFDIERKTKTRKEAVSATNLALGHGKNRGESGIATYVANIY